MDATPFDIPDTEFTHNEDRCTFDFFLERYQIGSGLKDMTLIIRGEDTDDHSLASQSSGLWAISAGLAYNITDDQELPEAGLLICNVLIAGTNIFKKKHTQSPQKLLRLGLQLKSNHQSTVKWVEVSSIVLHKMFGFKLPVSKAGIAQTCQDRMYRQQILMNIFHIKK